jgi:hypothetical protein
LVEQQRLVASKPRSVLDARRTHGRHEYPSQTYGPRISRKFTSVCGMSSAVK